MIGGGDYAPSLDVYARIALRSTSAETSFVSIVRPDQGVQEFPGAAGQFEERSTPIAQSLCRIVVAERTPLTISDARLDERFKDHPAVVERNVAAYLGVPLRDARGRVVGTVCALSTTPREWTEGDKIALIDVAEATTHEFVRRRLKLWLETAWATLALVALVVVTLLMAVSVR